MPSENSVFHKKEMVDIFQYLEEMYCEFYHKCLVYVTGDFNARWGNFADFIITCVLQESVTNNILSFIAY